MDATAAYLLLFWTATNFFWAAMFGAFVLYILNRLNNRQPFSLFYALEIKTGGRPWIIFADMMLSSAIGAAVVMLLPNINSVQDAATTGLGLTGVLSAIGKSGPQ
jgi:hypothetical protein